MFDKLTMAVAAATFVAAVSTGVSAIAADKMTQDKAFQECKAKGGWYQHESGVCEVETSAKMAAMQKDEQECQRKGGRLHKDTGVCEIQTKGKTKAQN
jgi:hypothetical protein